MSMSTATATGKRSTFFTDRGLNGLARAMIGRMYTGAADAGEVLRRSIASPTATPPRGNASGRRRLIASPRSATTACVEATG